jgi:hyperosmotically inducible periplasmic protein
LSADSDEKLTLSATLAAPAKQHDAVSHEHVERRGYINRDVAREPLTQLGVSRRAIQSIPMKTSILLTLALAVALTGCNKSTRSSTHANDTAASTDYTATANSTATTASNDMNAAATRTADDMRAAGNTAANAIGNAASNIGTAARVAEWHLTASDLQADLDNNREIVRTKETAAGAPTASSDKSVVESMVKSRLEADSSIAALKLKVDADKGGVVNLKGKAQSAEEVGRAIALALDTEGVTKVTSKIKLDKDAKTNP